MSRLLPSLIIVVISLSALSVSARGWIIEGKGSAQNIEPRKRLIERVIDSPKMQFSYRALEIIVDTAQREPRGKMEGEKITLSPTVASDGEFVKLLVHELAHYVDIYTLVAYGRGVDNSERFYSVSWEGTSTKKSLETSASFISGYAATNKYEDFAESFTFYIFHNREFITRAEKNESLRKKYLFFSEYVFPGGEFADTEYSSEKIPSYLWDTTKVKISLKKYLYSLTSSI